MHHKFYPPKIGLSDKNELHSYIMPQHNGEVKIFITECHTWVKLFGLSIYIAENHEKYF